VAQQDPLQVATRESRNAATAGLDTLRSLAREHYRRLGFSDAGQAAGANLGEPLVEFYVRLDSLRAFTNATSPAALLSGGDKVMYPIVAAGATRSSIEVERIRGAWRPVAYGGSTLATAIVRQRDQLVTADRRTPGEYFVVRIPALGLHFIGVRTAGALTLTPLLDDPRGRWKAGTSISAATLFGQLVADARAANGLPI
jgi:hypothetical protein